MKITLISDIHLEYNSENILKDLKKVLPQSDILICAGDISNPFEYSYRDFLQKAKKIYKNVIVIAGNHEYYQTSQALAIAYPKTMIEIENQIREICKDIGVIFLQKESVDIGNIRFYGCTLWADPFKSGGEEFWKDRYDYKHISDFKTPKDYLKLHLDHKDWLCKKLSEKTSKYKIVITHHIPSYKLIDNKFIGSARNGYYASECDDLIDKADIWIAGHTHRSIDQKLNLTRVICNPIGYPWEKSPYKKIIVKI